MQKMKSGLMMFCLTVLLSCAALMMNTGTASAMTLQDLCGDYRIVKESKSINSFGSYNMGTIIAFIMENGEFIGRGRDKQGKLFDYDYITNVFVENGTIHCCANFGISRTDCQIKVYNNGAILEVIDNDPFDNIPVLWELHRL